MADFLTNTLVQGSSTVWGTTLNGLISDLQGKAFNKEGTTTQTVTAVTSFSTSPLITKPEIYDTSKDHKYKFEVSELTADRTVTLPLLTGNDEFVFRDFTQTLTNKTLTSPVLNTEVTGTAVSTTGGNSKLVKTDASGNVVLTKGLYLGSSGAGSLFELAQVRSGESSSAVTETMVNLPDVTSSTKTGGMQVICDNPAGVASLGSIITKISDSNAHQYRYVIRVNDKNSTFDRSGNLSLSGGIITGSSSSAATNAIQSQSTTAFRVLNGAGTSVFNVDTSTGRLIKTTLELTDSTVVANVTGVVSGVWTTLFDVSTITRPGIYYITVGIGSGLNTEPNRYKAHMLFSRNMSTAINKVTIINNCESRPDTSASGELRLNGDDIQYKQTSGSSLTMSYMYKEII